MPASGYAIANRPNAVLKILPRSCNLIYDVMVSLADEKGIWEGTFSQFCTIVKISRQTGWRAMKRLTATRLIDIVEHRTGCGRGNTYKVRAFHTNPKSRKPMSDRVYVSFPQKSVTSLSPSLSERTKRELKTQRVTPGKIMARIRCVTNQHIYPQQRLPIQNTIGRMIFKEGRYEEFTSHPGILREILHLLITSGPSEFPPPEAPQRRIYAWFRGKVEKIIRRHKSGTADLIAGLLQHMELSTEKCNIERKRTQRRSFFEQPHRRKSYSERGLAPSWAH